MAHLPRFALVSATLDLVMFAACESASSPEPLDVRLNVADVWSGGEATLVSAAFAPPSGLPVVRLAGDTLVVRRLDDSTVAARLPDGSERSYGSRAAAVAGYGALARLHMGRGTERASGPLRAVRQGCRWRL